MRALSSAAPPVLSLSTAFPWGACCHTQLVPLVFFWLRFHVEVSQLFPESADFVLRVLLLSPQLFSFFSLLKLRSLLLSDVVELDLLPGVTSFRELLLGEVVWGCPHLSSPGDLHSWCSPLGHSLWAVSSFVGVATCAILLSRPHKLFLPQLSGEACSVCSSGVIIPDVC